MFHLTATFRTFDLLLSQYLCTLSRYVIIAAQKIDRQRFVQVLSGLYLLIKLEKIASTKSSSGASSARVRFSVFSHR